MSSSLVKSGSKTGKRNRQEPGKFVKPPPESETDLESSDGEVEVAGKDDPERVRSKYFLYLYLTHTYREVFLVGHSLRTKHHVLRRPN